MPNLKKDVDKFMIQSYFSINFKNGKRLEYKTPYRFKAKALKYNWRRIKYLGWSDGINSCGFSKEDNYIYENAIRRVLQFSKES